MPFPVILDCSSSPYSCLKPVPIDSVIFQYGFWADYMQTIKQVTIPTQYDLLESTGRLDNFRRINSDMGVPFQGYYFNDSDVYKWLEAACWALASGVDEQTQEQIDDVIHIISAAQDRDGYLNTYFSGEKKGERWLNLRDMHELYCAGHLIQAAVAHFRVTAQENLLTVAVDLADHICRRFFDSGVPATPGHPQVEMAFVELYRTIGDLKYLRMAQSFLDQRGSGLIGGRAYHLDHIPLREMKRLAGHAVRAMYLCCGAADIYLETGESLIKEVLENLWGQLVSKQMYITGGLGSRHQGEAFGDDFELPNARSYAETCAAIGSLMWNWRMLHGCSDDINPEHFQPEVKYADQIEWTLYNAVLPGISLTGQEYHYVNPLETYDLHERQPWFECACCPPNILRLLSSLGGYFYSHTDNNVWIHQYAANIAKIRLRNEREIDLSIETDYPWDGEVQIEISSVINIHSGTGGDTPVAHPMSFGINLRIPTWLEENVPIYINDDLWEVSGIPGSYVHIERQWKVGDKIRCEFPIRTRYLECHPYVHENTGRVAMSRGPLLYCIEAVDNPKIDPREVYLNLDGTYTIQTMKIRSREVTGIQVNARIKKISDYWMNHLYRQNVFQLSENPGNEYKLNTIPYFAWGNRTPGWVQIWLTRA
jgi:uncharacterized protein